MPFYFLSQNLPQIVMGLGQYFFGGLVGIVAGMYIAQNYEV